jgi:hypothetical protein
MNSKKSDELFSGHARSLDEFVEQARAKRLPGMDWHG